MLQLRKFILILPSEILRDYLFLERKYELFCFYYIPFFIFLPFPSFSFVFSVFLFSLHFHYFLQTHFPFLPGEGFFLKKYTALPEHVHPGKYWIPDNYYPAQPLESTNYIFSDRFSPVCGPGFGLPAPDPGSCDSSEHREAILGDEALQ